MVRDHIKYAIRKVIVLFFLLFSASALLTTFLDNPGTDKRTLFLARDLPLAFAMNHIFSGSLPLKYRCTNQTKFEEAPNLVFGVYCVMFGAAFVPLYILCLFALIQRDLRKITAYKIMILLGIFDITMLSISTFVTGFFLIKGVVYCTYPTAVYVIGCVTNSCWGGSCIGCFILTISRLVDLWSHRMHDFLFGGARIRIIIVTCVCYTLPFFLIASPPLFNVSYNTWIFDPVISDSTEVFQSDNSWIVTVNNVLTVTSTSILYIVFFASFLYKYHLPYGFQMASSEKQIFFQSSCICGINLILALTYVYMLYFPVNTAVTTITVFLWHFSTAGAVVVYLCINKTVRRKVREVISKKKVKTTVFLVYSS